MPRRLLVLSSASDGGIVPLPNPCRASQCDAEPPLAPGILFLCPVLLSILWEGTGNVQTTAGLPAVGVKRVPCAEQGWALCAWSSDAELLWPRPQGQGFGFAEQAAPVLSQLHIPLHTGLAA